MATVSPTPVGQGSHFTSLGRRTSARQALRRPPSQSQMRPAATSAAVASKRNSTNASSADAQYATLNDSSDDEMPIPMKLSALTKALLSDGASASEEPSAARAAAEAAGRAAPFGQPTRRRSVLNRSTSSTSENDNMNSSHPARQTRARHVRAGSAQPPVGPPSSASRATSPPLLRSRDSSPAPRKRVVRLSTTTPAAGGMPVQPSLRRSLSTTKQTNSRRAATSATSVSTAAAITAMDSDDKMDRQDQSQSDIRPTSIDAVMASAENMNTPASAVRRVQIVVGASGGRSGRRSSGRASARLSASSASALAASLHTSTRSESEQQPDPEEPPSTVGRAAAAHSVGSALRSYGGSADTGIGGSGSRSSAGTIGRSGSRDADARQATALQGTSSIRVKRVGKVLGGGFLSGPARRGRRQTSDENGAPGMGGEGNGADEMLLAAHKQHEQHDHDLLGDGLAAESLGASPGMQQGSRRANRVGPRSGGSSRSPYYDPYTRGSDYAAATGSPVSAKNTFAQRVGSLRTRPSKTELAQEDGEHAPQEAPKREAQRRQSYRAEAAEAAEAAEKADAPSAVAAPATHVPAARRPDLPSANDQENDGAYLGRIAGKQKQQPYDEKMRDALQPADIKIPFSAAGKAAGTSASAPPPSAPPPSPPRAMLSPERKVLGAISRNTPHRPAPPRPPPKMSVLETATAATAGAAGTAQANKKPRILLKVNGRSYQRVDCIGRGGSGKVYKVTAENGKMFAMKRVSLESADEGTIRGCLGEIDLLKKLSGVDRVIQLFDFEMNKEKQMLSLLMELGEMDLNSLLRVRQNAESARLDPVFVRFYWKEMLECLQAVHAHDIVHSDLKPANFVLVQGRLKLIDFGIANAIQTEMTVNVHRENQAGTPSYMSPESLMDAQQYAFTANINGGGHGAYGGRLFPPSKGAPRVVKVGKPSDVWSLGCILYQMVYGLPPFGHIQNQMARCQATITWTHAIDFPARGLGGVVVPPPLLATMRRCLNREQQMRPTCADLLAPTDAFLYPEMQASLGIDGTMPITEELLARIIQSVVTRCRERMPTDNETMAAWPAAYWASIRRAVAAREERQQ